MGRKGADGRCWVLGDRTQAPSGAGYALENRLVLSRAFASLYKSMNVERVAPFFEAFRDGLRGSADRDEPRIGVLTPGGFSETYFEHATLARYLGELPLRYGICCEPDPDYRMIRDVAAAAFPELQSAVVVAA